MALDPIVLDDLEWKGMVDAVRRRIPAASDGQWTLHAAVDPGVTLLELFAWQLEQRLYRMDQVPAELNMAMLAMLASRAHRTRCAHTVLQLEAALAGSVPRGSPFELEGVQPGMIYSSRSALSILKVDGLRLWTGDRERSADLAQGRVFALFPSAGEAGTVRIALTLGETPLAGGWFGLYLALRSPIAPQWSPAAAAGVPVPAPLAWSYRAAGGVLRPLVHDDGTGGLRRSGIVRLRIPADWQSESGAYIVYLSTPKASYTAPPRLVAIAPNAVLARHAHATGVHEETLDWLPLPGNTVRVDRIAQGQPVLDKACVLWFRERKAGWRQWWPITSLHACGPAQRAFVVDREHAQLRFGNGINGRLPVLANDGAPNMRLRLLAGGGSAGAVGASAGEANWDGVVRARNLTESLGGMEAETLEQARQRCGAQLRVATRCITRADFESLALTTPGVAIRRAHAAIGRHPLHPCVAVAGAVTIFIVPDAPREELDSDLVEDPFVAAPLPDPGAMAAVDARLQRARLVTTELFVSAPRYRAVRLRALLRGDVSDPQALRGLAHDRLRRFLDPLEGGDDGVGWPFGGPVRASVMLREVQAAVGKQLRVALVAIGLDGDEPAEACGALAIGPHDLVWLEELTLQFDRSVPASGGLR
jgi:predicted phage baseplate assembly protein